VSIPGRTGDQLGLFALPPQAASVQARASSPARKGRDIAGPKLALAWPCPECGENEVGDPKRVCEPCSKLARAADAAAREAELKAWWLFQRLRIELGEDHHDALVAENFVDPADREDVVVARAEAAGDIGRYVSYVASSYRAQSTRGAAYARAWRQRDEWLESPPYRVPDELPLRRSVDYLFFEAGWETEWEEEIADGLPVGESVWYPSRPVEDVEVGLWL
jgi:predicted RNA-binding Zn-ribbon protein involved in translation (DUF1610 family)